MRFFKAGKSKSPVIPVAVGLLMVIVIVFTMTSGNGNDKDYTPGAWEGNVYTSAFLKLQFTLPEGWTAATPEELDAMMRQALEQSRADDPATAKGYENGTVKNAYELMAQEDGGGGVAAVMSQKMRVSVDSYMDLVRQQYAETAVINELPGWTVGGIPYQGLKLETEGKVQYIYAHYEEGYFTTIQMTGLSDGALEDLKRCFVDYLPEA
ncbi:MAG: hypothetical protein HFF18_06570 [Oscillospiraceae bacterium]|nr:hypothetical protein [Oscillospiraceae bacterium]